MGVLKLYPRTHFTSQYDDIEADAISFDGDTVDDPESWPDAIDYWSVFLHDVNGGRECFADVETKEDADMLVSIIETIINTNKKQLSYDKCTNG